MKNKLIEFFIRCIYCISAILIPLAIINDDIIISIASTIICVSALFICYIVYFKDITYCPNCSFDIQDYKKQYNDYEVNYCPICGNRIKIIKYKKG